MSVSVLNPAPTGAVPLPRLRSVRPEESAGESGQPARPGVYRLPEHVVAGLQPAAADVPLVGYLVLVPAGSAPVFAPTLTSAPVTEAAPTPAAAPAVRSDQGIALDPELRTARLDGELLELTYLEFELLAHLTAHPHRVHTRDRLVEAVWGYGHVGDGRTVDVHVARLRRKLGAGYRNRIVTVRRVGYKYVPPTAR
ncbi:winged helix-turn-helix domain-containing protein [Streptacidiphilus rugosus]|uniref:winged helix-turn-helix domain-containing protein n=1 Tax=Streptacidiphilus rugosus TaxID=405783 RepID=UPI00055FD102|nr:winged helix-turn-helix domain-containing protein [Streptacidiphilus rugosus]